MFVPPGRLYLDVKKIDLSRMSLSVTVNESGKVKELNLIVLLTFISELVFGRYVRVGEKVFIVESSLFKLS